MNPRTHNGLGGSFGGRRNGGSAQVKSKYSIHSGRVFWLTIASLATWAAVVPTAGAVDVGADLVNLAPTLSTVTVASSVTPTAGSAKAVSVSITATDLNGYNDVTGVTVEVQKPDGSVHIASASATFQSGLTTSATYTYSFNMNFYDAAATGASKYKVKVTVTDAAGASVNNVGALDEFNYAQLAALSLGSSSLDLGDSLSPGSTGSAKTQTVQNYGNTQIDIQVSGTVLTHATSGDTIAVGNVDWSVNSDMSSSTDMTTSAVTVSAFDLGAGASSTKNVYVQLTAPSGSDQYVPAGTYSGTMTVSAVSG